MAVRVHVYYCRAIMAVRMVFCCFCFQMRRTKSAYQSAYQREREREREREGER